MNTSHSLSGSATVLPKSGPAIFLLCFAALLCVACSQNTHPQEFASPGDAALALTSALRAGDVHRLTSILGSEGEPLISSGDAVADRQRGQKFLDLYDEQHSFEADRNNENWVTLVIGKTQWPFPVPLVREGDRWVFNAAAGLEEILNRRIGENELSAMETCRAIADAQRDYAMSDANHDDIQEYAQQFFSDPGKRNGLYWQTAEGESPSPLGELVAAASAEGYTRSSSGPTPYHGYCYRILQGQGPHAPGGAMDYVVNGKMILGFGVVAYPAEYGNSGVMTFIMCADGVVYERDLGESTTSQAHAIKLFDPGPGWMKAQPATPAVTEASSGN